jgi:hypothetical protein
VRRAAYLAVMSERSYAIWWDEGEGRRRAGKLELGPLHALLSGNGHSRLAVPLDRIDGVELYRGEVLVHRRGEPTLRIGSLDAPGALRELAGHLVR